MTNILLKLLTFIARTFWKHFLSAGVFARGFFVDRSCTIASVWWSDQSPDLAEVLWVYFSPVLCLVKQQSTSPQTPHKIWGVIHVWCSISDAHLSGLHTYREAKIDLSVSEQMSPSSSSDFSVRQPSRTPGFPWCRFWGDPVYPNTHAQVTVRDTLPENTLLQLDTLLLCKAAVAAALMRRGSVCVFVCKQRASSAPLKSYHETLQ